MADNKTTGPKSEDSKREGNVPDAKLVAGADLNLEQARGNTFGDTTSSSSGANNPGQHGRDGGTIGGEAQAETTNNPAPSKEAIAPKPPEDAA